MVGFFRKLFSRRRGFAGRTAEQSVQHRTLRRPRFETMEPRRMLAADALTLAAVYVDLDNGADITHDLIEIAYEGGSPETRLQEITINAKPGIYFDTVADSPADAGAMIPSVDPDSSIGVSASDVSVAMSNPLRDGFQTIKLTIDDFAEGDVLSLRVDADEVEGLNGDPIVSSAEFELTLIDAVFVDPLYEYEPVEPRLTESDVASLTDNDFNNNPPIEGTEYGVFWDNYDPNFAAAGIGGLLRQDADHPDRSDGAVQFYQADPVEIHGRVHRSTSDEDCFDHDSPHVDALEGVVVYMVNDQGQWLQTETNANGDFWFTSADLPDGQTLAPGTYTLIEVTPEGLIDGDGHVGSIAGSATEEGILVDELTEIALSDGGSLLISEIVEPEELGRLDFITEITLRSGDIGEQYIFCEHPPAKLSGYVYHDANLNEQYDPGDEAPIANVEMVLLDESGNQVGDSVFTDSSGFYQFTGLDRGKYTVVELVQPEDFFDGADQVGTIDGLADDSAVADSLVDEIDGIMLGYGQVGENYNFGEIRAELTGNVQISNGREKTDPADPDHRPLEDISMYLVHEDGETLHTTTDALGNYTFSGLRPGSYTLIEVNPVDYIDGGIDVGSGGGVSDDVESIVVNGSVTELTLAGGGVVPVSEMESVDSPSRLDVVTNIDLAFDMFVTSDGGLLDPVVDHYCFSEHEPSRLSGYVYHDANLNEQYDPGDEAPIANVEMVLLDESDNQVGDSVFTDSSGFYQFTGLAAGKYTVVELVQPEEFFDGADQVGTIDGVADDSALADSLLDEIDGIMLGYGQVGENYNFGEIRAELTGNVQISNGREKTDPADPDHRPLEGISMYLVREDGETIHTTTDAVGNYTFTDLRPGNYTLIEVNPIDYIDGDVVLGTGRGVLEDVESISTAGSVTELTLVNGHVISVSDMESIDDPARLDVVTNITLEFDRFINIDGSLLDPVIDDYHFCENEFASLSGHVFEDLNDNGVFDDGETPIANAQVVLLNEAGEMVAGPQLTDDSGFYEFRRLDKGIYTVHELQPDDYFDGQDHVGDVTGDDGALVSSSAGTYSRFPANPEDAAGDDNYIILRDLDGEIIDMIVVQDKDSIGEVELGYGQHGVDYDFGEIPPSALTGNVYHDLDNDGNFDPGEQGLAGVTLELRLTFLNPFSGVALTTAHVVDPSVQLDSEGRYIIQTDADGHYQFQGIRGGALRLMSGGALPGNYAVYELIQPPGFLDGLDKSGSGGVADNSNHEGQPRISIFLQTLIHTHNSNGARDGDLLFSIPVGIGQVAPANNFGEIQEPPVTIIPPPEFDPDPDPLPPPAPLVVLPPPPLLPPPPRFVPPPIDPPQTGSGSGYSWHLSVVDGGMPRDDANLAVEEGGVWFTASYLDHSDWNASPVLCGAWQFGQFGVGGNGEVQLGRESVFGIHDGIPVAGDFNGDGVDEIGVFYQGEWFLDLNGNGRWDEGDLWSKLGDEHDLPVTGDWDGDGKDDIGIFGPEWPGDPRALRHEPGLPDADNLHKSNPKNVPPHPDKATNDGRVLRLTSRGDARADVIDHVLRYGMRQDTPIAGDWNGDGISTVGVFRNGKWHLDTDGDGRWSSADEVAHYGQPGDVPVVGDFDGDGVDELGVFRDGRWMIDVNGDRAIDAHDKVFEMGGAGDTPVVGDFNGDGTDDPAVYRDLGPDCARGAE